MCVKNWTYVVNTKEKRAILIWNYAGIKIKIIGRNCDLSVQYPLGPVPSIPLLVVNQATTQFFISFLHYTGPMWGVGNL